MRHIQILMPTVPLQLGGKDQEKLKFKEKVKFGAGEEMHFTDDGILGLAFPRDREATNIFEQAVKEGIVDEPVFTVYMKKCNGDCEDGGLITFGDHDKNAM
ncbi:unnamed protein product [Bursaphelenchus xylophilus]|uniref:(pine wood nematode) hypothetical protein n=1 Tax=Bursaphelenchus xylophilus TaxID=6326 RepID=A0A1I7RJM5_BURXY|nr:unnamed protein product [Bursaphelenchus xylophilus]CAG9128951.1 unnamed protein product [Bursaphelenchus xylophilus]